MSQDKDGKITAGDIRKLQEWGGSAEETYKVAKKELEEMYSIIVKRSDLIEKIRKDNNFPELD